MTKNEKQTEKVEKIEIDQKALDRLISEVKASRQENEKLKNRIDSIENTTPGVVTEQVSGHTARVRLVDGKLVLKINKEKGNSIWKEMNEHGEEIYKVEIDLQGKDKTEKMVVDYLSLMRNEIGIQVIARILENNSKTMVKKGGAISPGRFTSDESVLRMPGVSMNEQEIFIQSNYLIELPNGEQYTVTDEAFNF